MADAPDRSEPDEEETGWEDLVGGADEGEGGAPPDGLPGDAPADADAVRAGTTSCPTSTTRR